MFADKGLHAAKVEAITGQRAVSVGTIYNHIGDRDRVLETLIDTRKVEMLEELDGVLQEGEGRPFIEQLGMFLRVMLGHFEKHGKFVYILMQCAFPLDKAARMRTSFTNLHERIHELIGRGEREGVLARQLTDFYPSLLMGMVRAAFMRDRLRPRAGASAPARRRLRPFLHARRRGEPWLTLLDHPSTSGSSPSP